MKSGIDINFRDHLSEDEKIKEILSSLLKAIPTYSSDEWKDIFKDMGYEDTIGKADGIKVYKNASIHIIANSAKNHGWHITKDGSKVYLYDDSYWNELDIVTLKNFLSDIAKKLGIPMWIAIDFKFIEDLYKQLEPAGFFERMEFKNKTLLNTQSGTLHIDLEGINLEKFCEADFLTHLLDFQYNPDSVNHIWLEFLDTVLPDKDTQRTLQQSLGYLLTRDLKLEKAIFLYGTGSNGKSVIFEVLHGLLSADMFTNYSLESLTQSTGYHRANLNNKLINYGTDISMKKIEHGIFKQMVSGEPIEVRQIYEKPFIMKNYAKLIFNLNKIDDADVETTVGFFRRMVFIPFEKTIEKEHQDKMLHKKILANKAGILNWILEGLLEVLNNQEIFISKKCDDFLENFKKESNLVIRFIESNEIVHSEHTTSFQSMYESFKIFCYEQGEKVVTQRMFNAELKKLKFKSMRKSAGNVWFASYEKRLNSIIHDLKAV